MEMLLTALGRPVVPLLKFRLPQICLLKVPGGSLNGSSKLTVIPSEINSCTVLTPVTSPLMRKVLSGDMPTIFAACWTFSMVDREATMNLVFAVFSA